MNKKQLLLLVGLGIVLAAAALLVSKKQSAPYQQTTREGTKLLANFDVNTVATLRIRAGSNAVTLAKQGEIWVVKERSDYPANFGMISDLMRKFWDLKVTRLVPAGSSRLPMLGLDGPDGNSTLLEMKSAEGSLLRSVLLGTNSLNEARGWPSGRYVMLDSDSKTACFVADSLYEADPTVERWLNKDFFKVEKLKTVSVAAGVASNNWTLTRDAETAEWRLVDASAEEKLDSAKTSGINNLLSSPSFNDVIPGLAALDKSTLATLETFDGFTYIVKLAKQTDDTYRLQFAVSATFPQARTPGKDEKPEDKDKLDGEFKELLKKLEEKLKTEQAYAKWTYSVSKWAVEPLFKDRKDFLVEKKEDKKEEVKTSTQAPELTPVQPE